MTARKPLVQIGGVIQELGASDTIPDSSVGGTTAGAVPFVNNGVLFEDTSMIFIDYVNKRVGIGTNAPAQMLDIESTFGSFLNNMAAITLTFTRNTADANAGSIILRKSRGSSTSPVVVNTNDVIGTVSFRGHTGSGTTYGNAAQMSCQTIDPTPSTTAMGGRLFFSVSPIGSVVQTEMLRLETATGLSMFGANPVIDANRTIIARPYTVGTLPTPPASGIIQVTDDGGGSTLAFSDGSNWRRATDRRVVATTNPAVGVGGSSINTAGPLVTPQGRLTLNSGEPYTTTDVTGATTIYYTPAVGSYCPIYDTSSTWDNTFFLELSQTLADTTKSPAATVADRVYDMFVWNDIGTIRCTRGPAWGKVGTVTMTIAAPCVVTWNGHGFANGTEIEFTTTGSLPSGLSTNTLYWVVNATTNTFQISSSGPNGSGLTATGTQSGTHTAIGGFLTTRASGSGTSELQLLNGLYVNKNPITNGPAAQLGTYVGTIATDSTNALNMMFSPTPVAFGANNRLDVWNRYNQHTVTSANIDSSTTWTYTTTTLRPKNNTDYGNNIRFVVGLAQDCFEASHTQVAQNSAGSTMCAISICYDVGWFTSSVFTADPKAHFNWIPLTSSAIWNAGTAFLKREPLIGLRRVIPLEASLTGGTTTWFGAGTVTGSNILGSSVFSLTLAM